MATLPQFRFLAAVMAAFSLVFVAACGDVETNPTPTPTTDTGIDVGSDAGFDTGLDATPDVAPDTAPDAPDFSYEELCSECETLGLECPPEARVSSWQQEKAATVGEAADELCVEPPPGPCDGNEWIEEGRWQCDWLDTTLTLVEVDGSCHAAFEDGSNLPFRKEEEALILYDPIDGGFWTCTRQ